MPWLISPQLSKRGNKITLVKIANIGGALT